MAILYSWYGDDFTGSTDVLQQLASRGVPAVLFLRVPTVEELARFPEVLAVGIAGDSRSRSPGWMDEHLPAAFAWMRSLQAPVSHYKVCSTFDSSAAVGSIGRALELGRAVFPEGACTPVTAAAPHLRRYVCFGHLFAAAPDGQVLRIDRHPMSRHPVTPMHEADLRRHLGEQTSLPMATVELPALLAEGPPPEVLRSHGVVLFDGLDDRTQRTAGRWIWELAQVAPLFAAASSGLTHALVTTWLEAGLLEGRKDVALLSQHATDGAPGPLLVVSGSCSVATGRQIEWAMTHGFQGFRATPALLASETEHDRLVEAVCASLAGGRSTVVYTATGAATEDKGGGAALGQSLGDLIAAVQRRVALRRLLLCGGDTCSHAVQRLPLDALTWLADACPGGPLCRAHSNDPVFDGLELVLKGGQVGGEDLFATVARM